jgi:hypothetical protein
MEYGTFSIIVISIIVVFNNVSVVDVNVGIRRRRRRHRL